MRSKLGEQGLFMKGQESEQIITIKKMSLSCGF